MIDEFMETCKGLCGNVNAKDMPQISIPRHVDIYPSMCLQNVSYGGTEPTRTRESGILHPPLIVTRSHP